MNYTTITFLKRQVFAETTLIKDCRVIYSQYGSVPNTFKDCIGSPDDDAGCYVQDDLGNFFDFRGLNDLSWYNFELVYIDETDKDREYQMIKWAQAENPFSLELYEHATFWRVPGQAPVLWSHNDVDGLVHNSYNTFFGLTSAWGGRDNSFLVTQ